MKYTSKNYSIDAIQWTGHNEVEVYNFLENKNIQSSREVSTSGKNFVVKKGSLGFGLYVNTGNEFTLVNLDYYIIKEYNHFKIISSEQFNLIFEKKKKKQLNIKEDFLNFTLLDENNIKIDTNNVYEFINGIEYGLKLAQKGYTEIEVNNV